MRIALLLDTRWETAPRVARLFFDAGHEAVVNPAWDALDGFDVGVVRANFWEPGFGDMFTKAQLLEARGVPFLNSVPALRRCADKAVSGELLNAAGLDVPETWVARSGKVLPEGSHSWVVKPRVGSQQCAVEVFASTADARRHLDSCSSEQLAQERIVGRYWRVIATREREVRTYTMPVDSRGVTVLPRGAVRTIVDDPGPDLRTVGVAIVRALGGTLLGVDVIEDHDGRYWALEGNAGFGFNIGDAAVEAGIVDEAEALLRSAVQRVVA